MTAAILTLIGTLLGLGVWWLKRRAQEQADPLEQNRERYAEIDQEIAQGDGPAATASLNADLEEIERRAEGSRLNAKVKTLILFLSLQPLAFSLFFTGCSTVKVIPADQTLTRVSAGASFIAPVDGWFMADALYQRWRRALADRIQELETTK